MPFLVEEPDDVKRRDGVHAWGSYPVARVVLGRYDLIQGEAGDESG